MSNHKIVIYIPYLTIGGAEIVTLELANGLSKQFDVSLILGTIDNRMLDRLPDVNYTVVNKKSVKSSIVYLTKLLMRRDIEILISIAEHANIIVTIMVNLLRFMSLSNTKIILVHHTHFSATYSASNRYKKILSLITKAIYPLSDEIVAVSKESALDLSRQFLFSNKPVHPIYNGVFSTNQNVQIFSQSPRNRPYILAVGRLNREKNFGLLIRAYYKAEISHEFDLIILGEGSERNFLESIITELNLSDRVFLVGHISNVRSYIQYCELFVLSSNREALPTVLIEAMQYNSRIVSTDCTSGPREILADGLYGILVPVNNIEALAKGIQEGIKQTRPIIPTDHLHQFSTESSVQFYSSLIENLISQK